MASVVGLIILILLDKGILVLVTSLGDGKTVVLEQLLELGVEVLRVDDVVHIIICLLNIVLIDDNSSWNLIVWKVDLGLVEVLDVKLLQRDTADGGIGVVFLEGSVGDQ